MRSFRSNCGFRQFQQIVAWLLLVTFVPIAILSEGAHLLPGFGTCCRSSNHCQTFAQHCHYQSESAPQHQNSQHQNLPYQSSDSNPVEVCVVCEFCSLFNSIGIELTDSLATEIVSIVDILEPVLFSGEFFSLFLVRAPPAAIC